jgi:hypothetical protein
MEAQNRSESMAQLAQALAIAQGQIENASKGSENPYFKSMYSDLASVRDAIRKPFADNGLAVVQLPSAIGSQVTITTVLMHKSGEWISSSLTMTAKDASPQAIGSAITYCRRYALGAVSGVAPEDDDGEKAQGHEPKGSKKASEEVGKQKLTELQKPREKTPEEHRDYRDNVMPEEIHAFCRAVDKDPEQFSHVLVNFRRQFIRMKMEPELDRIVKMNADMHPQTSDPAVLKGIMFDLWRAMEEARSLGVS